MMPKFAITSRLTQRFVPYTQLTIQTICLLVQMNNDDNWHIYQEFHRPLPPS